MKIVSTFYKYLEASAKRYFSMLHSNRAASLSYPFSMLGQPILRLALSIVTRSFCFVSMIISDGRKCSVMVRRRSCAYSLTDS